MNVDMLPMVIFTVVTQMAVGTFIALGVIQLVVPSPGPSGRVDRIVDPVMYAVGPALVLGLAVSTLHMNDLSNTLNVFRHWNSSWLSREIIFGVGFAAVGFLFAVLNWYQWGSHVLRQAVAGVAAVLGIALVWAQSMVYYALVTVPVWHSWAVPFMFFATTVLLGVLAVGAALMVTAMVRARTPAHPTPSEVPGQDHEALDNGPTTAPTHDAGPSVGGGLALQARQRIHEINAPTNAAEWAITARILKAIATIGAAACVAILIAYPLYLNGLGQGDAAAQEATSYFTGPLFWLRLALLGVTAVLLGVFVHQMADTTVLAQARSLTAMVVVCLLLALTSELIGRSLHYASMVRIGI